MTPPWSPVSYCKLRSQQSDLPLSLIRLGPGGGAALSAKVFIQIAAGEDEEKTFARRRCRLAFWTKQQGRP